MAGRTFRADGTAASLTISFGKGLAVFKKQKGGQCCPGVRDKWQGSKRQGRSQTTGAGKEKELGLF